MSLPAICPPGPRPPAPGPSVTVYATCYNEADLLPHFLRHYERLAQRIVVLDAHSTDGSAEILKAHPQVDYRPCPWDGIRDDLLTDWKNTCWQGSQPQSDWVFVVDVDEFLYAPDWAALLGDPCKTAIRFAGSAMIGQSVPPLHIPICEQVRTGASDARYNKMAAFRPAAIKAVNYSPGCHACRPQGEVLLFDGPQASAQAQPKLLHYHYLGLDRLLQRPARNLARLSPINLQKGWGWQNRLPETKIRASTRPWRPRPRRSSAP